MGTVPSRIAAICLAATLSALASSFAAAQNATPSHLFQQTPQVLARYPDLDLRLDTPGFRFVEPKATTDAELAQFVDALAANPHATASVARLSLGTTPGGRDVPALLISREPVSDAHDLARLGRPIALLIGQQHGDEPAGGEAALAVAAALSEGALSPLLGKLSVVIVPRANPDGAAAATRENAAGVDINRDHGLLSQPEVRMLHRLAQEISPALVIDAHEYTVARRWLDKLGGLQAVDLMLLSSTHPMIPAPIRSMADDVFQPAVEKAIGRHHLTSFVYHTTSVLAGDRTISVGGNAPGIARNAFGLMGAVTFLLETRGVGIGLDSYQRRVATHVIAISALLEAAAAHAEALAHVVAAARATAASGTSSGDIIVAHTSERSAILLPLVDPRTGADRIAAIDMLDTRNVATLEHRAPPAGYLITPERMQTLAMQMELYGAHACAFVAPADAFVERYDILKRTSSDTRAINPRRSLTVALRIERTTIIRGTTFIPMQQPAAIRLALALEPDTPGSLSASTAAADQGRLGVSRLPVSALTPEVAAAMLCHRRPSTQQP